jgi:REP element-mobilizing transposase RayT
MTAPREILPGRLYLVTRRCTQRQYFLRPDRKTVAIFSYCLAEAAGRYEIGLVGWLAMSNHYHAVVHDPNGRLPAFLEHLHKMLARALNVRWSRWENLWSTEETCVTRLATLDDVLDKLVYVLANPIEDHLVDRVLHWPGSSSLHHLDGRTTRHERPRSFFRENGRMPAAVDLRTIVPPGSGSGTADASAGAWATRVREALAAKEAELEAHRRRKGIRVRGRKAVLNVSAFASPSTSEPRRNLRPALACKESALRIDLLKRLVAFRAAHESARRRFAGGDRDIEFPAGTYRFRLLGARCAPFPAAA